MASVLVHVELAGDCPTPLSRQLLGEGRRLASSLGASLYAVAAVEQRGRADFARFGFDAVVAELGRAGADKVMLGHAPSDAAMLWSQRGPLLLAAAARVHPMLVLFAANAVGRSLAPRFAAALGAVFVAEPDLERGPRGELVLSRAVHGHTAWRKLAVHDLAVPLVVTLPAAALAPASGRDEAELLLLEVPAAAGQVELLDDTDDDGSALERARVVVTAGGGTRTPAQWALITQLADALGAEVAATAAVCARGLAPKQRELGVGTRHVAPDLYVACAASGSAAHLGAIGGGPHIIAIDRDPVAPIFRVAHYGLVGELEVLVPALIEALRGRLPSAVRS